MNLIWAYILLGKFEGFKNKKYTFFLCKEPIHLEMLYFFHSLLTAR